jgi:hypothetical protein
MMGKKKASLIHSVSFSHFAGGGSSSLDDDDFSTFAGCELWSVDILLKDGSSKSIMLYDANPASLVYDFVRRKKIEIEFPEAPSDFERLEAAIRHR